MTAQVAEEAGMAELRDLAPQVEKWYPHAVRLARLAVSFAPPHRKLEAIEVAILELRRLKERLTEQRAFGKELAELGEKILGQAL